jgi:hypothetical protein
MVHSNLNKVLLRWAGLVKTNVGMCSRYWVGLDLGGRLGFGYLEQSFKFFIETKFGF